MKTQSVAELLHENEFFEDLSPEHIEFLAGCAGIGHFRKGQFVMLAGDPGSQFHLVRSGRAAVEIEAGNKTIVIYSPGPGDLLGWSWLLLPATWRYDVRVVEDVSTISFDAECVRKKLEQDFEFGFRIQRRILQQVVERLMATRIQLIDMYS